MEFAVRIFLQFAALLVISITSSHCFNLTVLHTNDVHSHFVQFNAYGGRCTENLANENKCFGGFARQVTKAKEIQSSRDNVIFLNGGDFYQGTVWYTLHRWAIVADLVNKLGMDGMSLGNHEFDDGLKGLFPFLKNLKTKVVVCNINASKVPEFAEYVKPSMIYETGGERIGVIGYITPDTKYLSSAGDLEFENEVDCIRREAKRLTTEEGLTKIIAVGHSGFDIDQDIAREVPEVDIVVGGHTNTFLYTGDQPSIEQPQGPYPFVVIREDGSQALVVQDYAFGKYMGYLEVQFDDEGRVMKWSGNPIMLDASVQEDAETLELLEPYANEVKSRVRQPVGKTNVLLRGDRLACRMRECNMGNFLADASLDFFVEQPTEKGWNFVAIALWNSGGIRASIDERLNGGNITLEDVLAVAPFGNTMDVVALKGKHLKEVLEHSVRDYDPYAIDPPGSLLQVSGLRLTYNMSEPVGSRLVEAYARCADCRIPQFLLLEDDHVYEVVMNTYMAKGGDGFDVIQKNSLSNRNTDELDVDIITKYAAKNSPVITGLEGRITILTSRDDEDVSKEILDATVAADIKFTTEAVSSAAKAVAATAETVTATTETVTATTETVAAAKETVAAATEAIPATETPKSNSLPDIVSGLNTVGSGIRKAGQDLAKIPAEIPKVIPILGRRR